MFSCAICTVIFAVTAALPAISNNYKDSRIVGGEIVSIEQFPFQVSLQVSNSHSCGGSILTKNYVLTAGHCISKKMTIRAGSNNTNAGGSIHKVVKQIKHENYSSVITPKNDIALLKVDPPFQFDNTRRPIELLINEQDIKDGQMATTSGFGVTDSGATSKVLRAVTVTIVNRSICNQTYLSLGFDPVGEDFICGGTPKGGKDSCQGDSGGPFIVNGRLAGIVSYGYGCGKPGIPGVYTNVAYFFEWIQSNIKF